MKYSIGDKVYFLYNNCGRTFENRCGFGVVTDILDEGFYNVLQTHTDNLEQLSQCIPHAVVYKAYLTPMKQTLSERIEYCRQQIDKYNKFMNTL